jgi:hypothetical protein
MEIRKSGMRTKQMEGETHEPREGPRTTKGEMHALIPK